MMPDSTQTTDSVSSLADLAALTASNPASGPIDTTSDDAVAAPVIRTGPPAPIREREVDAQGRSYATGKRKDAVARV